MKQPDSSASGLATHVSPGADTSIAARATFCVEGARAPISASSGKLRILHISKHCGYGNGSVHVAVDLACVQAQAGHDVVFASGGGTFVPMLERHGVRHVTMRQEQKRPLTLLRAAMRLIRLCRAERPSILHAHMMGSAVIGYIASRLNRIPLVTTVHNSFDWHSCLMRLGDRVVAVSHAERDLLVERGWNPARIDAVWNAPGRSPREAFMSNRGDIALQRPCVVAICGLHRRKGVFDIINACASVFPDFPDWRLYIAGEGPDRAALEQQAHKCGLAGRVIFLGFVPAPKTLFRQADIFVLASYADPGSLSIGEARSVGCAVIATAVGGTTEMLDYGEAGRLIAPGQPRQLAAQLRRLMGNPAERAALRAAAQAGSEVFNVERLVCSYGNVYAAAISGFTRKDATAVAARDPAPLQQACRSTEGVMGPMRSWFARARTR